MKSLLEKDQIISVVPHDFRNSNKGKIKEIDEKSFSIDLMYSPKGLQINHLTEFYSLTKSGVLYFESDISQIEGNKIVIDNPIKHRFLQRRQFSRISFNQPNTLSCENEEYKIEILDLSAGGMKIRAEQNINIEKLYGVTIELTVEHSISCLYEPIRIEKGDDGYYTLSGRFKNLSNIDKMTLVQFCLKKKIENVSKK